VNGNPALKIAYVAKMFPRLSETFVLNEILELERQGAEVVVFSALKPNEGRFHPQLALLKAQVVYLEDLDPKKWAAWIAPLWSRLASRRDRLFGELESAIAAGDPRRVDLVWQSAWMACRLEELGVERMHAHFATLPSTLAYLVNRIAGIPFSFTAHAKDIYVYRPEETLLAEKLAAADFGITVTEFNRRHMLSILPPEVHQKVRVLHNGVSLATFTPPDAEGREEDLILGVGRLVPKKGFDVLVEACGLLAMRGARFRCIIAGEGPELESLRERSRALGLEDRVEFTGPVTSEDVRRLMRRAAVFCLPCRVSADANVDALPTVLLEALATGLPAVSTRLSGIPEIIDDGLSGVLVDPEDADATARSLETILASPELRLRYGVNGRDKAERCFDLEKNVASLHTMFKGGSPDPHRSGASAATPGGGSRARVLYVSGDPGIPFGGSKGAAVHVRQFLDALDASGCDATLVTARRDPKSMLAPPYPVVVATGARSSRLASALGAGAEGFGEVLDFGGNSAMLDAIEREARGRSFDVVYERYSLLGVAGCAFARASGLPFVVEVNSPLVLEAERFRGLRDGDLARRVERLVLGSANHVIAVSEEVRDYVLGIVPGAPVSVLPNAVDPSRFDRPGDGWRRRLGGEDDVIVGFVGRVRPWHGVDRLVDALSLALQAHPRLRLCIVGNADGEADAIVERARERGIAGRVTLLGEVRFEDIPGVLGAMDILAAPYPDMSDFYFSPLKLFEYMAAAKPIVASRIGQVARLLRDGETALLVPPGDVPAMAGALGRIASNAEFANRLGRNARAAVESGHTWQHRMGVVLGLFDSVRGGKAATSRVS